MKIISWNVNGLRSVVRKGFLDWVKKENPDVLCLQEIKITQNEISPELLSLNGYTSYVNSAQKKGYSGVLVYTNKKSKLQCNKLNFHQFDTEGRFLQIDFEDFILINTYIPHGQRDKLKIPYKLESYKYLTRKLTSLTSKNVIMCGDFNVAHTELDLARPKGNRNNTMFTPDERIQIDKILDTGFIDSYRKFQKQTGNYSWWPYFRNARERNLGWRIDYVFVTNSLKNKIKNAFILKDVTGSDHCPVGVELDI